MKTTPIRVSTDTLNLLTSQALELELSLSVHLNNILKTHLELQTAYTGFCYGDVIDGNNKHYKTLRYKADYKTETGNIYYNSALNVHYKLEQGSTKTRPLFRVLAVDIQPTFDEDGELLPPKPPRGTKRYIVVED